MDSQRSRHTTLFLKSFGCSQEEESSKGTIDIASLTPSPLLTFPTRCVVDTSSGPVQTADIVVKFSGCEFELCNNTNCKLEKKYLRGRRPRRCAVRKATKKNIVQMDENGIIDLHHFKFHGQTVCCPCLGKAYVNYIFRAVSRSPLLCIENAMKGTPNNYCMA